jgi:hypothetical protein
MPRSRRYRARIAEADASSKWNVDFRDFTLVNRGRSGGSRARRSRAHLTRVADVNEDLPAQAGRVGRSLTGHRVRQDSEAFTPVSKHAVRQRDDRHRVRVSMVRFM